VRIVIVIHTWMIMMTGVGKENKKEKKEWYRWLLVFEI
jgi:hypothetical protein